MACVVGALGGRSGEEALGVCNCDIAELIFSSSFNTHDPRRLGFSSKDLLVPVERKIS